MAVRCYNVANGYGGGINLASGTAVLTETQILSNTASSDHGGGVRIDNAAATLTMRGGAINANVAQRYGGGVYVNDGTATLTGTQILSNTAATGGGAYISDDGSLTMTDGAVSANDASSDGGGVFVRAGDSTLYIAGGAVTDNAATNNGGGVFVEDGTATLTGTQILSNSATADGGGLYLNSNGTISATNSCVVFNSDTAAVRNSGTFSARDVWWGGTTGPDGVGLGYGDSVSADVDYANFKTAAPVGCPAYPASPEAVVWGNGERIFTGDTSPSTTDGTDFGTSTGLTDISHTFTISNTGDNTLNLSNVGLGYGTVFTLTQPTATAVSAGDAITVTVTFKPTASESYTDTVTISSDDRNESPYTFVVAGNATNVPPVVDAGDDQSVSKDATVQLDGSGSADSDAGDTLTYGWRQTGGSPAMSLSDTGAISPTFTATDAGVFTFTLTVTDTLGAAGEATIVVTVTGEEAGDIYLPLIVKSYVVAPDLVITALSGDSSGISLTIKNIGNSTAVNDFWVDVYFNPSSEPQLNQRWYDIATAGAAWGVTKNLAPDEELTLTVGDQYYDADESSSSFPDGAAVYGYVDSINYATTYGNVWESNEANNLWPGSGSAGVQAAGGSGASTPGLPER